MPTPRRLLQTTAVLALTAAAFVLGRLTADRQVTPAATPNPRTLSSALPATAVASADTAVPAAATGAFARRATELSGSLAAEEERQRTLEQWAETDPYGALEFARTQLKGDRQAQALSSILAIWGKHDPAAAWAWVGREMPDATYHFDTLLEVFGKQSTALAQQYASAYASAHPESALEVNLAALLGVTYRGDFNGARAYMEAAAAANPAIRANLANFIAGQWARFAPAAARDWVLTLPEGEQRNHALVGLGESWSENDPAGAAAFATTLPEGESRSLAMRQAIAKWVETDPDAARNWVINSDARQDFDAAVEAIATQNNFMYREPAQAVAWATGIFDEEARLKTLGTVLYNWATVNHDAALSAIAALPDLTEAQRNNLRAHLAPLQAP